MGCHRQISRINKTDNFDMCGNLLIFVLERIPWVRFLGEAEADMS